MQEGKKNGLYLLTLGAGTAGVNMIQFHYVCFILLLLLTCILLILACSWLIMTSKAVSWPSLIYTFIILLPIFCFNYSRKRINWPSLSFHLWPPQRSRPDQDLATLALDLLSDCGWNGRATWYRIDPLGAPCSAEAVHIHILGNGGRGQSHLRFSYTAETHNFHL